MKSITLEGIKSDMMNKIAVFSSFLLVAAISVYLYSPVIGSFADNTASPEISVEVGEVMNLSTSSNSVAMSASVNTFVHSAITLSVTTNAQFGYTLAMEDADSNTNMVHNDSTVTDVISSNFTGAKTSSTMPENSWGFSVDNGANYYYIPPLGVPTLVARSDASSSNSVTTSVDFGVKVGVVTSGIYSDTVTFTAFTNCIAGAPRDGQAVNAKDTHVSGTMQSFSCSSLTTGQSVTLKDARDNNAYTVVKAADGKCWMAENLRLANYNLTSADSNVATGFNLDTFFANSLEVQSYIERAYAENPAWTEEDFQRYVVSHSVIIDKTYGGFYIPMTIFGGFENYSAAEAILEETEYSGTIPYSICPKNWHIPTADEYLAIGAAYNDSEAVQNDLHFRLAGNYEISQDQYGFHVNYNGQGKYLRMMTSSAIDGAIQTLHIANDEGTREESDDFVFYNVRCIAN